MEDNLVTFVVVITLAILALVFFLLWMRSLRHRPDAAVDQTKGTGPEQNGFLEGSLRREHLMAEDFHAFASALKNANERCVFCNLSKNIYHMIEYEEYFSRQDTCRGTYDSLIAAEASHIPDKEQRAAFEEVFDREKAIADFLMGGVRSRNFVHSRMADDGLVHWTEEHLLFQENEDGDIILVVLDLDITKEVELQELSKNASRREKALRRGIAATDAFVLEIDLVEGRFVCGLDEEVAVKHTESLCTDAPLSECNCDRLIDWWSDRIIVSGEGTFAEKYSCASLLSRFKNGVRFIEDSLMIDVTGEWKNFYLNVFFVLDDDTGNVNAIAAFRDMTEVESLKADSAMLANLPSGIHRCYLSDPAHLEAVSKGLCEMLGYKQEEFESLVGEDYCRAVYEPDRAMFEHFVERAANEIGRHACEYRMAHKDGHLVYVSDVMESVLEEDGIVRGYSVVSDVTSYKELLKTRDKKLEEAKRKLYLADIKNSTSQMQPHFLYNALGGISEIVLDDPDYASELIIDFTTHLRACIRAMSNDNLVPFSKELENIRAYVNIEKMRFGESLQVRYEVDAEDFEIVPLSIQPLVENAIRHGLFEKEGGTVAVRVRAEGGNHIIEVEDDGVGFDVREIHRQVEAGERDSTGLQNLEYRLEHLMNARVRYESERGKGTCVTVFIPAPQ